MGSGFPVRMQFYILLFFSYSRLSWYLCSSSCGDIVSLKVALWYTFYQNVYEEMKTTHVSKVHFCLSVCGTIKSPLVIKSDLLGCVIHRLFWRDFQSLVSSVGTILSKWALLILDCYEVQKMSSNFVAAL